MAATRRMDRVALEVALKEKVERIEKLEAALREIEAAGGLEESSYPYRVGRMQTLARIALGLPLVPVEASGEAA